MYSSLQRTFRPGDNGNNSAYHTVVCISLICLTLRPPQTLEFDAVVPALQGRGAVVAITGSGTGPSLAHLASLTVTCLSICLLSLSTDYTMPEFLSSSINRTLNVLKVFVTEFICAYFIQH